MIFLILELFDVLNDVEMVINVTFFSVIEGILPDNV